MAYRGGFGGVQTTPKFRSSDKVEPDCKLCGKCLVFYYNILISLKLAEFRKPAHQDVRKKGTKILKLPRFAICFAFAMANKLVVLINSLKVLKIKKILLHEMKFLVPNYSCLQNP